MKRKKTKSKASDLKRYRAAESTTKQLLERLRKSTEAQSPQAEAASLIARALMADAMTLRTRMLSGELKDDEAGNAVLKNWMDRINRFLLILCEPLELEHVVSLYSTASPCGCGECYVMSFADSDEAVCQMLQRALQASQPKIPAINVVMPSDSIPS